MTPTEREAKKAELRSILQAATAPQIEGRVASTEQLQEIMNAANLLKKGIEALNTIGLMLAPKMTDADELISKASRSDITTLFEFFGEVLHKPAARNHETADLIYFRGARA